MTTTDSRPAISASIPNVPASDEHTSPAAMAALAPDRTAPQGIQATGGHVPIDTRGTGAAGSDVSDPVAKGRSLTITMATSLLDPALCLAADVLDDIERVRTANENRLRQLVRTEVDSDGEERGFGLDPDHPDVMRLGIMIETLKRVEHEATLELQRKMRKHPLGDWVKAQHGVGLKQGARLLAAIGDPYINSAKGTPRTVSALWAYCGLHVLPGGQCRTDDQRSVAAGDQHRDTDHGVDDDRHGHVGVAARRQKGQRANWSTKAKMRAYLIAEKCVQTGKCPQCRDGHERSDTRETGAVPACACTPYRLVYLRRREHTAITHLDWTPGHSHNDALRILSKEILKNLWRAARAWHDLCLTRQ